jgi:hypothetical protein
MIERPCACGRFTQSTLTLVASWPHGGRRSSLKRSSGGVPRATRDTRSFSGFVGRVHLLRASGRILVPCTPRRHVAVTDSTDARSLALGKGSAFRSQLGKLSTSGGISRPSWRFVTEHGSRAYAVLGGPTFTRCFAWSVEQ